jgi:hypothetical protein
MMPSLPQNRSLTLHSTPNYPELLSAYFETNSPSRATTVDTNPAKVAGICSSE